jgi:hypothetical protein
VFTQARKQKILFAAAGIAELRRNQLPVSDTGWQHGSQLFFATFV